MTLHVRTAEGSQFEALWQQYADLVYNLSIRLECSSKKGWVLARAAFLEAHRSMASLAGRTPSHWLYGIVIQVWYTPYLERRTLWRRLFFRTNPSRDVSLPHSVMADLTFLSEEQEALLLWLKALEEPVRLAAILHFGDGFSVEDVARITPLKESKIRKYVRVAAEKLSATLHARGISLPSAGEERDRKIAAVLQQWRTLKAPLTLKVDVMNRRVTQKLLEHEHIENFYSLNGMAILLAAALTGLVLFLAYCWKIGHMHVRLWPS